MAKKSNQEVRFIRKGGRVIPIRVKKGSGSRGGRMRAAANTRQQVGAAVQTAGTVSFFTGINRHSIGSLLLKSAGNKQAKSKRAAGKFLLSSKGSMLTKGGLAAMVGGIALQGMGQKQRARESRALNKGEFSSSSRSNNAGLITMGLIGAGALGVIKGPGAVKAFKSFTRKRRVGKTVFKREGNVINVDFKKRR